VANRSFSEPPVPDNLQFDRAEPVAGVAGMMSCASCKSLLTDTYFVVNGHIVCDRCRRALEDDWNRGSATGRFWKALGLGVLATVGCSILWYAVLMATDRQWGILAVIVGLVIGRAVHKGSQGRGGWRYQTLAIVLTYTAIVFSYVPLIVSAARERAAEVTQTAPHPASSDTLGTITTTAAASPKPSFGAFALGVVVLLGILYAMPFLAGIQNILGILIIGFALYEAWKLNRRVDLKVSGPHQVSMASARP
jgi:hypothetical protein